MPTFPFKRSVGQDLRDLFQHERLRAQSPQLGQSSIDPGEGMLEVRDASGDAIAAVGHGTGASGLLIKHGGSLKTVGEVIGIELASGISGLSGRMTAAENAITDLQQTRVTQAVHNALAARVGAAENDITNLQQTRVTQAVHNALAARVGNAEGRLDSHVSRIGALENADARTVARLSQLRSALNQVINNALVKSGGSFPPPVNW